MTRTKQPSALSRRLARTRLDAGMSLRDLEQASTISNSLISQIESGHCQNPGVFTIQKLARGLKCDPAWLAFGRRNGSDPAQNGGAR